MQTKQKKLDSLISNINEQNLVGKFHWEIEHLFICDYLSYSIVWCIIFYIFFNHKCLLSCSSALFSYCAIHKFDWKIIRHINSSHRLYTP